MKVAILFFGADGQVVHPAVAAENPPEFHERIMEVPVRVGMFWPILVRTFGVRGQISFAPSWVYYPPESVSPTLDDPLREEFGPHIPDLALLIEKAPDWITMGLLYVRDVYRPLFSLPTIECEGFAAMAKNHPKSFNSFAHATKLSAHAKKRLALAILLSKWEEMKRRGRGPTPEEKVTEFERTTGESAKTLREMQAIQKRISRGESRASVEDN